MNITIDIKPEVEAELAAQAADKGMDLKAYAESVLEEAARPMEKASSSKNFVDFLRESPLVGLELDLERETQEKTKSLSEFFMESPLAGSEIRLDRDRDARPKDQALKDK